MLEQTVKQTVEQYEFDVDVMRAQVLMAMNGIVISEP